MSTIGGWKRRILRTPSEIRSVLRAGKKIHTRWYRLYYHPTTKEEGMRFAILTGRRLGGAVRRNQLKRRFREVLRNEIPYRGGLDIVIIPEPSSLEVDFQVLRQTLQETLLHRLDL